MRGYLVSYACGHWRQNLYRKRGRYLDEQAEIARKGTHCPECQSCKRNELLAEKWGHEFMVLFACGHSLRFFKLGNGAERDAKHFQEAVTRFEERCPTCVVVYPPPEAEPEPAPLCVECGEPLNLRTRNGTRICGRCAWGADAIYLEAQRR